MPKTFSQTLTEKHGGEWKKLLSKEGKVLCNLPVHTLCANKVAKEPIRFFFTAKTYSAGSELSGQYVIPCLPIGHYLDLEGRYSDFPHFVPLKAGRYLSYRVVDPSTKKILNDRLGSRLSREVILATARDLMDDELTPEEADFTREHFPRWISGLETRWAEDRLSDLDHDHLVLLLRGTVLRGRPDGNRDRLPLLTRHWLDQIDFSSEKEKLYQSFFSDLSQHDETLESSLAVYLDEMLGAEMDHFERKAEEEALEATVETENREEEERLDALDRAVEAENESGDETEEIEDLEERLRKIRLPQIDEEDVEWIVTHRLGRKDFPGTYVFQYGEASGKRIEWFEIFEGEITYIPIGKDGNPVLHPETEQGPGFAGWNKGIYTRKYDDKLEGHILRIGTRLG